MLVGSGSAGEPVVTDFGLAVSASARQAGGFSGTPAYMAPEQARGGALGPQTDIYAVGLIICEMLTRKRPILDLWSADQSGKQLASWLSAHAEIPPAVRGIVVRCLQFRSEDRFQNAREIASLLDAAKRRHSTRQRAVAAGSILVALSLAAAAVPGVSDRIFSRVVHKSHYHRPTAAAQAAVDDARLKLGNFTQAASWRPSAITGEPSSSTRCGPRLGPSWPTRTPPPPMRSRYRRPPRVPRRVPRRCRPSGWIAGRRKLTGVGLGAVAGFRRMAESGG